MSPELEPKVLVCSLADAPMVARGSVFHHQCAKCGRRVAVAPTGQRFLKDNPQTQIVCLFCFTPEPEGRAELTASKEQILEEMRTATTNLRRSRN